MPVTSPNPLATDACLSVRIRLFNLVQLSSSIKGKGVFRGEIGWLVGVACVWGDTGAGNEGCGLMDGLSLCALVAWNDIYTSMMNTVFGTMECIQGYQHGMEADREGGGRPTASEGSWVGGPKNCSQGVVWWVGKNQGICTKIMRRGYDRDREAGEGGVGGDGSERQ
ncbi:hypothetical protein AG1IA_08407 [Rhizoctonia solani AG-1 IA]|uniref:Uncharacterized protein n=1 Tax=Thanatephorus cucumeris (strain AG1-IA) TaxID=983506 RepID=L8WL49_THACA|nr:hypothetical protein AG1IA_08407 [Rhizoctonia solani AG-1 IA]